MKENNINNAASNNNFYNEGGIVMTTGTMTMDVFAGTVKEALSVYFEDCTIQLQEVKKNNGRTLHGISIREQDSNLAPTIYLEAFFEQYQDGRSFVDIVKEIAGVYEAHRVPGCFAFDTGIITDYERAKDSICFKVVNTERNTELLSDVPSVPFCDLSIIFYIKMPKMDDQEASVTIHNSLMDSWGIDKDTLFEVAKYNTPRLLPGNVRSMESVLPGLFYDEPGDFLSSEFDGIRPASEMGLYVATNRAKLHGAAVFLYDNLLSGFADRIGADFYILPSSIHELIFLPDTKMMDAHDLKDLVMAVNSSEVMPEEVLSDNVYHYSRATGLVEIA